MKSKIYLLFLICIMTACHQGNMNTPENLSQFKAFKAKEKFIADETLFYTGIDEPVLRALLTDKINHTARDFEQVAYGENPTDEKFQEKIGIGLNRFSDVYMNLDTEDRERICMYMEELMDIVGLESSAGQLNTFMYGFDPTASN